MLSFASFFKIKPIQIITIVILMIARIPLVLMLLVLIPFLIHTLNSQPGDAMWADLLGHQFDVWLQSFFAHTRFEYGIPLSFQKNGFTQSLICIAFLSSLLSFLSEFFLRDYGEKIAKTLRTNIAKKFLSLPFISAFRFDTGFLSSMVGTDVRNTQQTFVRLIMGILNDGLTAVIFIFWLMCLDYQLFILFTTVSIPASLVLTKTGKVLKRLAKEGLQFESELLSGLLERMRGWQTIQIYKATLFEIAHFDKINQKIFNTWKRATRAKSLSSPIVEWIGVMAGALVAVIAFRRVSNGEISNSVLVSFVLTVGLLANKFNLLFKEINEGKKGLESLRRILNFLNIDFGRREIVNFDLIHKKNEDVASLEIQNLSIENFDNTVLIEKLSGLFKTGDFVVLMGPSGIGKTTFLNVLLGIQKSSIGQIFINNKIVNEKEYLDYSQQIGFIPQEPHIFQGSLLDNIFYPQTIHNPTTEHMQKVYQALQSANLNINLNVNVSDLSGGEKQRLMFARIFFNEPRLIMIDEGTSALDLPNETKILQTLRSIMSQSIVFVVSHRTTVKQFATHIIDLSKYQNYA